MMAFKAVWNGGFFAGAARTPMAFAQQVRESSCVYDDVTIYTLNGDVAGWLSGSVFTHRTGRMEPMGPAECLGA